MNAARRTIKQEVRFAGVTLFTGVESRVTLSPGGQGVRFSRGGVAPVPLTPDAISYKPVVPALAGVPARHTCVASPGGDVATVEHLLSALVGLGITDLDIDVGGPEVPIFDGSAKPFVDLILAAGLRELGGAARRATPQQAIRVDDGRGGSITLHPAPGQATYEYILDYPDPAPLAPQRASWSGDADVYAREVAPARTFSFEHEARAMHSLGLFRAFTPRDMLVLGVQGPIDNALRFPDEPARHKLLDLVGDLLLAGVNFEGRVVAHRAGHRLNHEMARRIRDIAGLA